MDAEKKKKKMNLPNKLTLFRICMVPVFLVILAAPLPLDDTLVRILAACLFALTCLTDMIDGKIARKYDLITDFGKFMDPLADKFLVFAAMLGILTHERFADMRPVFVWAAAIVIFRELAVTSIRLVAAGKSGLVIAASWLGKIKTTTQMVCIVVIFLEPVVLPFIPFRELHILSYVFIALMAIMTLWSGIDYLSKYWKFLDTEK